MKLEGSLVCWIVSFLDADWS